MSTPLLSIRSLLAALSCAILAVALAACSSLVPETQKQLEAVDPVRQDVSELLLTFDLPAEVQPVAGTTKMSVNFTVAGQPARQVEAVLVLADPGDLADALPPPASGRAYYFMGFSEADKQALRAAQAWARSAGNASAAGGLTVAPRFCGTGPVDVSKARFSVKVNLPGAAKDALLIKDETLANALALSNQTALEPC